jgi:hypothetical protein
MISPKERNYQIELKRRISYVSLAERLASELMDQGTDHLFTLRRSSPNGTVELNHVEPVRFHRGVQIIRRAIEADQALLTSRQSNSITRVLKDVKTVGIFLRKILN